jgi:hypothetical protein
VHLAGVDLEVDAGESLCPGIRLRDVLQLEQRQVYSSPVQSFFTASQSIAGNSGVG